VKFAGCPLSLAAPVGERQFLPGQLAQDSLPLMDMRLS
jgi:hypothetical protein